VRKYYTARQSTDHNITFYAGQLILQKTHLEYVKPIAFSLPNIGARSYTNVRLILTSTLVSTAFINLLAYSIILISIKSGVYLNTYSIITTNKYYRIVKSFICNPV
jgi:hypothetical protein